MTARTVCGHETHATGQPVSGQPVSGQPVTGQPVTGQPVSGQPVSGQPVSGQPVSGQPVTAAWTVSGYRERARQARDRLFAGPVQATVSETAGQISSAILPALADLRRIVADQGDAAGEVAEVMGRAITRLSGEVEDLVAEIGRLREHLDRVESRAADRH
ncbi:MAG: hypothetical protein ACRDY0_10035 [Acidimicrobiales bacterium]